jgi:feruloyl esterase
MKTILVLSAGLVACFSGLSHAEACFDLYKLTNFERAVEPGQVVAAANGVPEHCVVRGVVNRSIRFEVRMPSSGWNGRFLMAGTGGSSGYIADTTTELARGFAMSSTDTGHEGSDASYAAQPEAALDYAFRAVHLVALLSKEVIATYYDRNVEYSYYQGCSNGGRQGMVEATRYPEDFDGIVAGAPAFQVAREFMLWSLMVHRAQQANPLTEAQLVLLDDASRSACDGLDRVEDGIINDPRQCTREHYDPTDLLCARGQDPDTCLSGGQLDTVLQHYRGLADENGRILSPGLLPGAEAAGDWRMWALPGMAIPTTGEVMSTSINEAVGELLKYWVYQDADYDPDSFDLLEDRADLERASNILDVNSADLTEFEARGGKILMYQGWNDYPLRPQRAIDYLHNVEAANGGSATTRNFFRLFMVPGMVHCGGGPGAFMVDYLGPLVRWVENGEAPEALIGDRPDDAFTRRHCVYPEIAHYRGGDTNSAESFSCEVP